MPGGESELKSRENYLEEEKTVESQELKFFPAEVVDQKQVDVLDHVLKLFREKGLDIVFSGSIAKIAHNIQKKEDKAGDIDGYTSEEDLRSFLNVQFDLATDHNFSTAWTMDLLLNGNNYQISVKNISSKYGESLRLAISDAEGFDMEIFGEPDDGGTIRKGNKKITNSSENFSLEGYGSKEKMALVTPEVMVRQYMMIAGKEMLDLDNELSAENEEEINTKIASRFVSLYQLCENGDQVEKSFEELSKFGLDDDFFANLEVLKENLKISLDVKESKKILSLEKKEKLDSEEEINKILEFFEEDDIDWGNLDNINQLMNICEEMNLDDVKKFSELRKVYNILKELTKNVKKHASEKIDDLKSVFESMSADEHKFRLAYIKILLINLNK
jgi:hypothetical protein